MEIAAGMELIVDQDPSESVSNTDGTPYLIKRGDTLGLISDDVYGTTKKWRKIWENNRKLIKDANRIYAGFYLYYLFSEQDRLEKESFKQNLKPSLLTQPESLPQRDVSSVSSLPAAQ